MNNNKKAHFNEAKQFTKKDKVQKGQAGSNRQKQEHEQDDGKRTQNYRLTQYIGGETQVYDIRQ